MSLAMSDSDHDLLRGIAVSMDNIEEQLRRLNGTVAEQEKRLNILWVDRAVWNWVIRVFILGTPIAVILANYLSSQ